MRLKEAYYKSLCLEAEKFLISRNISNEFILRQIIKTKEFKSYLREKISNEKIQPLFVFDEKKKHYIYNQRS